MINYSFLEILDTLSTDETRKFRQFLYSPYFNKSKKVLKLYEYVMKYKDDHSNPKLSRKILMEHVSPNVPFNEVTFRRLLYDMQLLTERFLKQINFDRKPIESQTFLVEEAGTRGAEKSFYRNIKYTLKMIDSLGFINGDVCLNRFRLETDMFYFGMINNKINKKSFVKTEAGRLINGITYLISYFMLEAIKHNDTLLSYSRSFNLKYNEVISEFINLFDFQKLAVFMKKNSIAGSRIIEVYINALKAYLYFEDENYYKEFRNSLFENRVYLAPNDNNFLFARLAGYCTLKTLNNKDVDEFFDNELYEIYRMILVGKYYKTETNKYLQADLFRNILNLLIKLKEYKWLETFIETYSLKLHPRRMSDVTNFSYASLYFELCDYESSIGYLSNIKMDEFVFNLDIRNLYLRIYYELNDYDAAFSFAKSYMKFIKENELVTESKAKIHENFIKFMMKLLNFHNQHTKTNLASLYIQINKCKEIIHGDWLINKIKLLDGSIGERILAINTNLISKH